MDGTTIHDGVSDFIGSQQNYIESFEEVKVDVGTTSAAYNGIGQLTVISKSGTNSLHAAVFDYYVTPWFRARNPFATARQPGVSHLYGASIGGPVYIPKLYNGKNRTFFFFSREGSVGGDTVDILNPTVPIAAWRAGNFSSLTATIYDPASGTPFPNNTIPSGDRRGDGRSGSERSQTQGVRGQSPILHRAVNVAGQTLAVMSDGA